MLPGHLANTIATVVFAFYQPCSVRIRVEAGSCGNGFEAPLGNDASSTHSSPEMPRGILQRGISNTSLRWLRVRQRRMPAVPVPCWVDGSGSQRANKLRMGSLKTCLALSACTRRRQTRCRRGAVAAEDPGGDASSLCKQSTHQCCQLKTCSRHVAPGAICIRDGPRRGAQRRCQSLGDASCRTTHALTSSDAAMFFREGTHG